MIKTTQWMVALSATLAISLLAEPAAPATSARDETIGDRHHILFDAVIPDSTDAPYGMPGDSYDCLSCHAVHDSSGTDGLLVETDCRACHGSDRHHLLYNSVIPNTTDASYGTPGELYDCLSCHAVDSSSGTTRFLTESDCRACHDRDNHDWDDFTAVIVDVKPGSKRNRVNLKSKGLVRISIRGSAEYDLASIDIATLRLEGEIAPLSWRFRKRRGAYVELKLKFSVPALRRALDDPASGQTYEIHLSGRFEDGGWFVGSDSFFALPRARGKQGSEGLPSDTREESIWAILPRIPGVERDE